MEGVNQQLEGNLLRTTESDLIDPYDDEPILLLPETNEHVHIVESSDPNASEIVKCIIKNKGRADIVSIYIIDTENQGPRSRGKSQPSTPTRTVLKEILTDPVSKEILDTHDQIKLFMGGIIGKGMSSVMRRWDLNKNNDKIEGTGIAIKFSDYSRDNADSFNLEDLQYLLSVINEDSEKRNWYLDMFYILEAKYAHAKKTVDGRDIAGTIIEAMKYISNLRTFTFALEKRNPNDTPEDRAMKSPLFLISALCDVFESIEYLHKKGLIHRDIKPANLFLGGTKPGARTKIGDMTTVIRPENCRNGKFLSGTLRYSSPNFEEMSNRTYASDAYALGVVCFEMLDLERISRATQNKSIRDIAKTVQDTCFAIYNEKDNYAERIVAESGCEKNDIVRFIDMAHKLIQTKVEDRFIDESIPIDERAVSNKVLQRPLEILKEIVPGLMGGKTTIARLADAGFRKGMLPQTSGRIRLDNEDKDEIATNTNEPDLSLDIPSLPIFCELDQISGNSPIDSGSQESLTGMLELDSEETDRSPKSKRWKLPALLGSAVALAITGGLWHLNTKTDTIPVVQAKNNLDIPVETTTEITPVSPITTTVTVQSDIFNPIHLQEETFIALSDCLNTFGKQKGDFRKCEITTTNYNYLLAAYLEGSTFHLGALQCPTGNDQDCHEINIPEDLARSDKPAKRFKEEILPAAFNNFHSTEDSASITLTLSPTTITESNFIGSLGVETNKPAKKIEVKDTAKAAVSNDVCHYLGYDQNNRNGCISYISNIIIPSARNGKTGITKFTASLGFDRIISANEIASCRRSKPLLVRNGLFPDGAKGIDLEIDKIASSCQAANSNNPADITECIVDSRVNLFSHVIFCSPNKPEAVADALHSLEGK